MSSEMISIGGVYFPIFIAFLLVAGVVYFVLRWIAIRLLLSRYFWHPTLAGTAIFVIVLSCLLLWFGP